MAQDKLLIINVLNPEVYDDCRIKGSINIPYDRLEKYARNIDKDTKIIVYCASYTCDASRMAYKLLEQIGFKHVWAYEGGMSDWYHQNFPVEGSCKKPYLAERIQQPDKGITEIPSLSAQELYDMMKKHGLL